MNHHHQPLCQSAEKTALWKRLGIQSDADHKMLLAEASEGRDRLSVNPANLTVTSASDTRVQPPYRWDQLTETAKHKEILNIWARASPRARYFYEKAHYHNRVGEGEYVQENWAIRWYLWHSFRYRDNRDTRGTSRSSHNSTGHQTTRYYDAARSQFLSYP